MIKEITFTDEELKEALKSYFKIKGDITFWYVRNFLGNNHIVRYIPKNRRIKE